MKSQITIRLPEDLEEDLNKMSQKFRLKRSDIVRMALEKFAREFRGPEAGRPYEKVVNVIGTISSGLPDLGEAHRRYLLKKIRSHA
jgi:metal-responsive CopG/Arc/MetJ family transcriptional regulator